MMGLRIRALTKSCLAAGEVLKLVLGLRILLAVIVLVVSGTPPADAQNEETRWVRHTIKRQVRVCDWYGCTYQWRHHHIQRPRYYAPPREREYELRDYRHSERRDCQDTRRVVGNQHLTVDGAKKAADDAWAGDVRFRYGELFMNLDNARHVSYTCSRSSIKEPGITTLGQTFTRCEIQAAPCKAPRSEPLAPPQDKDD